MRDFQIRRKICEIHPRLIFMKLHIEKRACVALEAKLLNLFSRHVLGLDSYYRKRSVVIVSHVLSHGVKLPDFLKGTVFNGDLGLHNTCEEQ